MHDVIVVGGGPGGLSVSTLLARQGFDIVAVEEHQTMGEPVHCTGVLASEAFGEFDLPRESVLNPLSTARFFSPSGHSISYTTPSTEALVVDRAVFDHGLHARADAAGAAIMLGVKVTSVEVGTKGVFVRAADGRELRGRVVVLACGANYAFQRRLGLGIPSVFMQSAQMELPAGVAGDVEVHFGRDVAPKGFAWVVPVRRGDQCFARVGLMCEENAGGRFKTFASGVSGRWGLGLNGCDGTFGTPRQKILPLAPIGRTYGDRVLAVGDAAGLVKATTGGGIYYSLVSGTAAATVLGDALRKDTLTAKTFKQYESIWRKRLGSELRAQLTLRMLAHRLGDRDIEAFFELARTNGVMPIVHRTARFNRHRDLIVSLLKHQPARRLLFRQLIARTAALAVQ